MELTFSELRAKEVVNTQDGRKLGKVCDIVLCYPENRWIGIVAPSGKGWSWKKGGVFIDLRCIVKIGDDVILVNIGMPQKPTKKGGFTSPMPPVDMGMPPQNRRSFEEYE